MKQILENQNFRSNGSMGLPWTPRVAALPGSAERRAFLIRVCRTIVCQSVYHHPPIKSWTSPAETFDVSQPSAPSRLAPLFIQPGRFGRWSPPAAAAGAVGILALHGAFQVVPPRDLMRSPLCFDPQLRSWLLSWWPSPDCAGPTPGSAVPGVSCAPSMTRVGISHRSHHIVKCL